MADNEVNLEILVEVGAALSRLADFEKKSAESLGRVEKAFGAIKVAAVAAIGILAGGQIVKFLKDGIESAEKQEQALAKLTTQLDQTGENTDEAVKAFVELGDELERTSRFEDDAVIGAAALAKSFGLTNDQAITLTKAAAELAAVTGDSLETATRKLSLTYSGVTGKLDEQVPAIKALTKAQLANGDAVKIVLERYGGAALREIQTFSGSISQTEKAFGNLGEAIATSITQSPVAVSAIQAIGGGFARLQAYVEGNKEEIDGFVNGSIKILATSVPLAVDVLGFLVKSFEALTLAGSLAFSGLLDVTATFGRAWQATFGAAQDALLGFAETTVKAASEIPLLSQGFDLIGVSLDDSAAAVASFRGAYASAIDDSLTNVEKLRDGTAEFAADSAAKFDSFNDSFDAFGKGVDAVTQGIFDADTKIVESAKKVAGARREVARATAEDAKETEKLREEAKKFLEGVANDTNSEAEKVINKRFQDLAKVQEFFAKGIISAEQAAEAEVKIREVASGKVDKIFDDEDAKYEAVLKERLEKLKQSVTDAASNPLKFTISKLEIAPAALNGLEGEVGATVGALGKILDGKSGAKNLVTEGAAAFADSFIPGIGGAVGSIVGKLTEGPEAVKEFIKGFVDGIPDIIVAVAESAPVVIEALVDSLINEGGLIRIAAALLKALSGEAILKNIGKQLGINVGTSLNADNIGQTIGGGLQKALPDFSGIFKGAINTPFDLVRATLPAALRKPFDEVINKLSSIAPNIGSSIGAAFTGALPNFGALFGSASEAFTAPVRALFQGDVTGAIKAAFFGPLDFFQNLLPGILRAPFGEFVSSLKGAFDGFLPKLAPNFAGAADAFIAPVRKLFQGDVTGAITGAFMAPINFFKNLLPGFLRVPFDAFSSKLGSLFKGFKFPSLPAFKFPSLPSFSFPSLPSFSFPSFPTIETPGWLKSFTDTVDKLTNFGGIGGGGGGGKKGPVTGIPGSPLATGGIVPPGFPRDNYPARLTSGERVLTGAQNEGLMQLLEEMRAGRTAAAQPAAASSAPVQVILQLGERQLASALVDLNRQGFRTA